MCTIILKLGVAVLAGSKMWDEKCHQEPPGQEHVHWFFKFEISTTTLDWGT